MTEHQVREEIDIVPFLKHFYNNRRTVFRVVILSIIISLIYSFVTLYLNPPIYKYTSQSVIDMTIDEGAEYQKPMFISHLTSRSVFEESAKSIGLEANYLQWRDNIVIASITGTSQIVFKITSTNTDKLVELNRRIVNNTVFQSSNILTGIIISTVEEAELLEEVQEIKANVNFIGNSIGHILFGLLVTFTWLTLQVISDKNISSPKDVEAFTDLSVIGTIPDFKKLSVSEEINMRNFLRGLIWKKKK